jgi:hypothetical protein
VKDRKGFDMTYFGLTRMQHNADLLFGRILPACLTPSSGRSVDPRESEGMRRSKMLLV